MIRLRQEKHPPPYQLDLAVRLVRSAHNSDALRILKADPLYPVRTIEVTHVNNVESVLPHIGSPPWDAIRVPRSTETSVKVAYIDALEPYQTADDKLWSSEEWGIYRYHVRDWFHDAPYTSWDLNEGDMRYHKFEARDLHVYTLDDADTAVVVWTDIESNKDYIAAATITTFNAGTKC